MIRGFVLIKNPEKAIEFYDLMRSLDVKPTKFTFVFVLKAYSLIPSFQEGKLVHGKLVKFGFCNDVYLRNGLIHMYSKCGDIRSAHLLFDEMPERNVVNWNTMIVACFDCGDIEGGRKLFDEMPERNVESWNAIISGYSKWDFVDVARSLFDMMPEKDLFSWSGMISSYVRSRRAKEALELFEDMMQNSGVKPDSVTMVSVLSACSQIGALEMGRWIHAYVGRNKLKYDVFLGTSLIDMYANCGCINIALEMFNSMPCRNIFSWNAILCGLALNGLGSNALELFERMNLEHVKPNDVTFVGVLCACCHIGSVNEGRRQFNRMVTEFGIAPKIEHFGCMVDILGRAGLIDEAKELVQNMPMDPNIVVLGALLSACRIHGVKDVGEEVLKQLHKLEPGDGGCYVLLSNINAADNRWDEVMKTRKMMRDMGVEKKIPGCSSIEVNSVVHQFLADDKLHPNWREVYEAIDRLSTHLEVEGPELELGRVGFEFSCLNQTGLGLTLNPTQAA
ncbi:Pentatricopeptide repeat [Macleaya cordata]|uniref:Pentatricopeptide repeat n=1 Tax=Macleaya cordata TaxID=56857 RepID=A0A200QWK6_MACCD|nr:Pentatricopeptide repeat [Macleaya cordata]